MQAFSTALPNKNAPPKDTKTILKIAPSILLFSKTFPFAKQRVPFYDAKDTLL